MRRKDREMTDGSEIVAVLARCRVVHIAMGGADYPYIVAANFGVEARDGRVALYIHSAKEGEKIARMAADPRVCVQAEIDLGTQRTGGGITNRYESVVGYGTAHVVRDARERERGLACITRHYGYDDAPGDCPSLPKTLVVRIDLERLTGKRNLPTA